MKPNIMLTGASGFLGRYVQGELRRRGLAFVTAGRRNCDVQLDLTDAQSITAALRTTGVQLVLHAGAMSRLGKCEEEPDHAQLVNARPVGFLAKFPGVRVVLVSTDQVFSGRSAPYLPTALPEPLSAYGRTKRNGELELLAAGGLIVRLPLLFGRSADGRTGATDMLNDSILEGYPLGLFTNEFRTPMHALDAARALVDLLMQRDRTGVVHVAGPERVSRWELACRFCAATDNEPGDWRPVESISPLRPKDVSLISEWECGRSLDDALAGC